MADAKPLVFAATLAVSVGAGALARNLSTPNEAITRSVPAVPGLCNLRFEGRAGARFESAFSALAPHLAVRFDRLRRCLGYHREPHRLARLHVRWELTAGANHLRASAFELTRVEGQAREPLLECFALTFAAPVNVAGVPEPAARLSYRGVAPSFVVYEL